MEETDNDIILDGSTMCRLPKVTGPCTDYIIKWYYNMDDGECQRFWYGGCQGNDNKFALEDECVTACKSMEGRSKSTPPCQQPRKVGPCRAHTERWYYNSQDAICETFIYGGCQGNDNNFVTRDECERQCPVVRARESTVDHSTPNITKDVCLQPREAGPCRGSFPRWFYEPRDGICLEFLYGGCEGNSNNFMDKESCQHKCQDVRSNIPSDRIDNNEDNNYNGREKETETRDQDVCLLPMKPGDCGTYSQVWYYDYLEGRCESFVYRGCNGNENRFNSQEECESTCSRQKVCVAAPPVEVVCLAYFPRWRYNEQSSACEEFVYGGCGGNANNFISEEACNRKCGVETVDTTTPVEVCMLPKEVGPCRASIPSWYYDHLTGQCTSFGYGGCQGNQNNFKSQEDCERTCSREEVCREHVPAAISCRGYFKRWRYLPQDGQCEQFVYGGCGGNANNFETQEACDQKCRAQERHRERERNKDTDPEYRQEEEGGSSRTNSWSAICQTAPDRGPCDKSQERWYFNRHSRECKIFIYGGCAGNHNNFQSDEQCMQYCGSVELTDDGDHHPERPGESCHSTPYGCCPDGRTAAYEDHSNCYDGPIVGGCAGTRYGCCPDGRTSAEDDNLSNCYERPGESCHSTPYGCCDDGRTAAYEDRSNCYERLGESCHSTPYGCCPDERTAAYEDRSNCYEHVTRAPVLVGGCAATRYGCCHDGLTSAVDENLSNCYEQETRGTILIGGCAGTRYGCCPDGQTYAADEDLSNCHELATRRPILVGGCAGTRYGCCPDGQTSAHDEDLSNCYELPGESCHSTPYGCCPDGTPAYEDRSNCYDRLGESCHSTPYGCCLDGKTAAYEDHSNCDDSPHTPHMCGIPRSQGDCDGREIMWYFDKPIEDCRRFVYTGCGGNGNKFATRAECLQKCMSDHPDLDGNYQPYTPRPTYRPYTERPPILTDENTKVFDLCDEESDRGHCSDWEIKWFYNKTSVRCERFYYGGCDGNANRFDDEDECRETCTERRRPVVGGCAGTRYGCCSDGRTSAVDEHRSNCYEQPIVGGCAGTRYGCCSDGQTSAVDEHRSNCYEQPIVGGCAGTRYGCCSDGQTSAVDEHRSNCYEQPIVGGCAGTRYGCCSDGQTSAVDEHHSNCYDEPVVGGCEATPFGCCPDRITAAIDPQRSNCYKPPVVGGCESTPHGCCPDGITSAIDRFHSNCLVAPNPIDNDIDPENNDIKIRAEPGNDVVIDCQYQASDHQKLAWYKDGYKINLYGKFTQYSNGSLLIRALTSIDGGVYACKVSNGNVIPQIQRYLLQVQVPIGIFPTPEQIIVRPGQPAFLHCQVYGQPRPDVSWSKGSSPITNSGRYKVFDNGTLIIDHVQEGDRGDYECVAVNGISNPVRRTISLSLEDSISVTIDPHKNKIPYMGKIRLICEAKGYPTPNIEWQKMGKSLTSDRRIHLQRGHLTIVDATSADTGMYTCVASNQADRAEKSTSIHVAPQNVVMGANEKCVDKAGIMKCRLITAARLCGHSRYKRPCCASCKKAGYH
ncbi:hypothetical protein ScPMuIL_013867 [Solemya velum]